MRSKDERRNRNAIYFIIIETTLQNNEALDGIGWFILIKSGVVCFHATLGRNLLEMPSAGLFPVWVAGAVLGGLGLLNWENWAMAAWRFANEIVWWVASEG